MGIVIDFPSRDAASSRRVATACRRPAQVVILPVIRIERYEERARGFLTPAAASGRKRKRRASRS